jgi:hypothetical protein
MADTTKFMGKGQLIDRLTAQVGSRGMAIEILQKRGHVDAKGNLTPAGEVRNAMSAEERAIDRSSKKQDAPAKAFKYNPATNRATLKVK